MSLTIITNIKCLEKTEFDLINDLGIELCEFNYSFDEMQKIYAEHHVLLQLSSDDSFGLTVLEAMKSGMAIISSDMYAFKEMVEDGKNGFLVEQHMSFSPKIIFQILEFGIIEKKLFILKK